MILALLLALADDEVTYTKHVAPILFKHCASCHRPGEIGPFPLLTYADASKRAKFLKEITSDGRMPPWKAAPQDHAFRDERRLTDEEKRTIARWADGGSKEGDAKDLPAPPKFPEGWQLGTPDVVLKMAKPFTVPATGRDVYRCFVIPIPTDADRTVAAVEFRPGNPKVVHHAIFYTDALGQGRKKDPDGSGYASYGGPGILPTGGLGAWAPGATPRFFPDGMGLYLRKGSDLVLQVHYHPSGKSENDQSRLGLYFAKQPIEKEIVAIAVLTHRIDIPAGEANYERHASLTLPVPVSLISAAPHMHYLGKEMKAQATTPDGRTIPLVRIEDWNFNWQGQYLYARPIELPAGTRIDVDARYDNSPDNPRNPSSPPRRVRFGEQSTDEMCICFFQATARTPEERQQIRRATLRALFGG
jgi:hypothetical protein